MSIRIATLSLALAALASAADQPGKVVTAPIHAIEVAQMGGNPLELGEYEGDVLLIVNVAARVPTKSLLSFRSWKPVPVPVSACHW